MFAIQNIWRKTPYHLYGRGRNPPNMAVPHIQSTCGPPPGLAERGRLYRGPSAARLPTGGVQGCISSGTVGSGCLHHQQGSSVRALPPLRLDTWRRGRGRVHVAVSDLNVHAQPSHSACTLGHLPWEAVPPGVPDGAFLFPPAPGVVRMYFVCEVRPCWGAFGLSHTNCMGFSAIYFVWQNICPVPKANRGWRIYFVLGSDRSPYSLPGTQF